ncbi:uncharacterized protein NEMAJ01_0637 [Nematocida major]|uniref:uncharacterized protein n=1 Tax=Nematocida major TaxID=1912982 RepID=UPI002008BC57|nr:uncharacterized protein NEMAJ01_0637 [Nematocida major]KAH9385741.1 hypothetical protein NEMAJ01_0637 [Nematocida major]
MSWFFALLEHAERKDWVKRSPEMALGILVHFIASKTQSTSAAAKEKIRRIYASTLDYLHEESEAFSPEECAPPTASPDAKKQKVQALVTAMNGLFLLIEKEKSDQHLLYYAPIVCDFILSKFATERVKVSLARKVSQILFMECPDEAFAEVANALARLEEEGEDLPEISASAQKKATHKTMQRLFNFQREHPKQLKVLHKLGIDRSLIARPCRALKPSRNNNPEESSPEKMHLRIEKSLCISAFLEKLQAAFDRKLLGTLPKKKELEMAKALERHEKAFLSETKASESLPVEIIQHSLAWGRSKTDVKRAAKKHVREKAGNPPKYVPVLLAWCELHDRASLQGDCSGLSAESAGVFWDSFFFFLSLCGAESVQVREAWNSVKGHFRGFLRLENTRILERLHRKYPWTLKVPEVVEAYTCRGKEPAPLQDFYVQQLVLHRIQGVVEKHGLHEVACTEMLKMKDKSAQEMLWGIDPEFAGKSALSCRKTFPFMKVPEIVEYAEAYARQTAGISEEAKKVVPLLLKEDLSEIPAEQIREILCRTNREEKVQILLHVMYMFALLETDAPVLDSMAQALDPDAHEKPPKIV